MQEYEQMFCLNKSDLHGRILGCADGPASFNAEMTRRGHQVVSCDPIYIFTAEQISERFTASIDPIMLQVRTNPHNYVWTYHQNPDELLQARKTVMQHFLSDFRVGSAKGRYVVGELPRLPFEDQAFDLALCSHLLFLYSDLLSFDFHLQSILELCRVAAEARLFPLTSLNCELSRHLPPLQQELERRGLRVELVKVNYQLQRNGDHMMRVFA